MVYRIVAIRLRNGREVYRVQAIDSQTGLTVLNVSYWTLAEARAHGARLETDGAQHGDGSYRVPAPEGGSEHPFYGWGCY